MKRMFSLLLVTALASSCGTAPHAESLGESHRTTGAENERSESNTSHYVAGGALAVVVVCAVFSGVRRVCLKQFRNADSHNKAVKNAAEKLTAGKNIDELDEATATKVEKLYKSIGLSKDGKKALTGDDVIEVKDGIFFTAYDKTIGKLVRKIKKSDEGASSADEGGKQADEGGKQADEGGKQADEGGKQADEKNEQN